MKMKKISPQLGFTLLEILIATGIFMTTIVIGVAVFGVTTGSSATSEQIRVNTQSIRYVFENIAREIRLSRGLVELDTLSGEQQRMIVPPFKVEEAVVANGLLLYRLYIYSAKKSGVDTAGNSLYTLTVKRYEYNPAGNKTISFSAYTSSAGLTVSSLRANYRAITDFNSTFWTQVGQTTNLLPNDLVADQFKIARYKNYPIEPLTGTPPLLDELTVQPFMQLTMGVLNPAYNATRPEDKKIRTTLRTMVVARNFANPFDVVQPGIQGASD